MGSGWGLHSIIQLELHTVSFNPLRGETYFKLPKELANKKLLLTRKIKIINAFYGVFLEH